jgi:hypothetical protein
VKTKLPKAVDEEVEERVNQPVPERKKALTAREWKFVWEWVSGDGAVSLKEAALRAGYKPTSALESAKRLTDANVRPDVVAAIQEARRDLRAKYGTSLERHMKDLMDIRDRALAANNFSAAVAAEFRRGQALGTIYVDRKEIRVGTIDTMTKEEVMRKLEELRAMYEPLAAPVVEVQAVETVEVIKTPQLAAPVEVVEPVVQVQPVVEEEVVEPVVQVQPVVEEEEPEMTIREGLRNVDRTRKQLIQEAKKADHRIRDNEARIADRLRDTRLLSRSPVRGGREDI